MLDHGQERSSLLDQPQSSARENAQRGKTVHLSLIRYVETSDLDLTVNRDLGEGKFGTTGLWWKLSSPRKQAHQSNLPTLSTGTNGFLGVRREEPAPATSGSTRNCG